MLRRDALVVTTNSYLYQRRTSFVLSNHGSKVHDSRKRLLTALTKDKNLFADSQPFSNPELVDSLPEPLTERSRF